MFGFLHSMRRPTDRSRRSARRPYSWQPRLEELEDRRVPTTLINLTSVGTISSYAGVGFRENVLAGLTGYVNGVLDPNAGDFSAQVNWEDGSGWQAADIGSNNGGSGGTFLVKGGHVYSQVGIYNIQVQAFGPGGTSQTGQTVDASVANMPSGIPGTVPPAVTPSVSPGNVFLSQTSVGTISSYAGVGFQENVTAGLTGYLNGQLDNQADHFHAFINWGDSDQWFAADIGSNNGGGGGTFLVKAGHVYNQAGSYHIVVYAIGADGTSRSSETSSAAVANMSSGIPGSMPPPVAVLLPPGNVFLSLSSVGTISSLTGVGFQQNTVAGLSGYLNGQLDNHASDFQALINWGDSNQWFLGSVVPNNGAGGTFLVLGSHVYNHAGTYSIVVFAVGPDGTSRSSETAGASVQPNPNPGGWHSQDVAVGSDTQARLLWRTASGADDVWRVNNSLGVTAGPVSGPVTGWAPIAEAAGGDGLTRVLWTNASGQAALWLVNGDGSLNKATVFGPFGSWTAEDLSVGNDNASRLLWSNGNGQMVVWRIDDNFAVTSSPLYGPYSGWMAVKIAAGADNLTRVLWDNANGATDLWLLNADGSYNGSAVFGPIAGWSATDLTVGSDGQAHILWTSTSGAAALWQVNNSFAVTGTTVYGPIAGWRATALSAGADGVVRLLWDNTNGAAALWLLANNGAFQTAGVFGPF